MHEKKALAITAIAVIVTPGTRTLAQPIEFVDVSRTHLPLAATGGNTMDAEVADLNGDGRPDVVLAVEFGANCVLFGSERGLRYDADALPGGSVHDSEDIAIADLDGDGDLDLVFVAEDDQVNELYLNDGQGRFEAAHDRIPVGGTSNAVVAHDVDGDGDLDLLVSNEDGHPLLLSDGAGRFVDETDTRLPMRETPEETREGDFGDIDGDGDLDIVFANVGWREGDPQNRLLVNDGSGFFEDVTASQYPVDEQTTIDADFVDIDGDGDLDLVAITFQPGMLEVLLNDGRGTFTNAPELGFNTLPWIFRGVDVEVADLNGDGVLDAYLTNHVTCDVLLYGRPVNPKD